MTTDSITKSLADFSDAEIRDEYAERFTITEQLATFSDEEVIREYCDRIDLSRQIREYDSDDLIEELERRHDMPEVESGLPDEIVDLLAEAARISRHAARANVLLDLPRLEARQRLIAGRMSEVAA